eukprot:CAMPEP_0172701346 /NCGR_PEP_ID=MMETSP1074-20121228/31575_1 /TAXON_ID=2916 /ORGANISM="Ceratium fusus, Strain PA161109" /LENGTH=64 /DNA_ID=CAMNT_0013522881 /DNA_START=1 /DNA_END=191 /DNA_ORIENTATION=-
MGGPVSRGARQQRCKACDDLMQENHDTRMDMSGRTAVLVGGPEDVMIEVTTRLLLCGAFVVVIA